MKLSEPQRTFLQDHHGAAMITVGADGYAKAARVGIALVENRIWSSGTRDRTRTKRLRRDPRATLFVFDVGGPLFLTIEATVNILDGPEAPAQHVQLFRQMQGKPTGPITWYGADLDEEAFTQAMVDEGRLVYEFVPIRAYGIYESVG